jgi:hypothetical protein
MVLIYPIVVAVLLVTIWIVIDLLKNKSDSLPTKDSGIERKEQPKKAKPIKVAESEMDSDSSKTVGPCQRKMPDARKNKTLDEAAPDKLEAGCLALQLGCLAGCRDLLLLGLGLGLSVLLAGAVGFAGAVFEGKVLFPNTGIVTLAVGPVIVFLLANWALKRALKSVTGSLMIQRGIAVGFVLGIPIVAYVSFLILSYYLFNPGR